MKAVSSIFVIACLLSLCPLHVLAQTADLREKVYICKRHNWESTTASCMHCKWEAEDRQRQLQREQRQLRYEREQTERRVESERFWNDLTRQSQQRQRDIERGISDATAPLHELYQEQQRRLAEQRRQRALRWQEENQELIRQAESEFGNQARPYVPATPAPIRRDPGRSASQPRSDVTTILEGEATKPIPLKYKSQPGLEQILGGEVRPAAPTETNNLGGGIIVVPHTRRPIKSEHGQTPLPELNTSEDLVRPAQPNTIQTPSQSKERTWREFFFESLTPDFLDGVAPLIRGEGSEGNRPSKLKSLDD